MNLYGAKQLNEPVDDLWLDPLPITAKKTKVDPLPPDALPDVIRNVAIDISHRMQTPADFAAATLIVQTGTVIGAGCSIRPKQNDNWQEVPNLYGGIVGDPATKKSPTINQCLQPIRRLEEAARTKFEHDYKEFEANKTIYEQQKKIAQDEFKKLLRKYDPDKGLFIRDSKSSYRDLLESEPKEPKVKRFLCGDTTIEKLGDIAAHNSRGILVVRDELMALINSWYKPGHENDRQFYLEGWSGNLPHQVDRIKRGSLYIPNLCISVIGGIQPTLLIKHLSRMLNGENDGMFQRFNMLVYPDPIHQWQNIDREPDYVAINKLNEVIEILAMTDFIEFGAVQHDEATSPYFHFEDDAQQIFYKWQEELHNYKIQQNLPDFIKQHLAKYESLVPSLALIFHLVDCASNQFSGSVSKEALLRAIAYVEYLESHMHRIYSIATDIAVEGAKVLCGMIEAGDIDDTFTARKIYRMGRSLLDNPELVQSACEVLEQHHWIQSRQSLPTGSGGRPTTIYYVNPKVERH